MMKVTIYHNPKCSKSRQTLALLEEQQCEIAIIEYLKQPPSESELKAILTKLGLSAHQLIRTKDTEYKELGLTESDLSADEWIHIMHSQPKLIERPIVLANEQAIIGRPPENIYDII